MATSKLILELDAKTAKLDKKLDTLEKKLDGVNESTKKVDKSLVSLTDAAKFTAKGVTVMVTAFLAANAAISAMVLNSAQNRRELELMARQAKLSADEFQSLASATKFYGVNAEQIADISKDVADRIGEFSAVGTGTFQDYADVIKLTKEEARATAIEFQALSSPEVIGRMVSEMEKAGVSGDKMTFVLESMGNDLSKLTPLFINNSTELERLQKRFDDLNGSLLITSSQADELKKVSQTYDDMTTQIGNATTAISATLAPVMDDFFNDVIDVVPQATQTIIDFINSFLDAENITTISGINKQIQESQGRLLEFQEKKTAFEKQDTSFRKDSGASTVRAIRQLGEAIELERIRTGELNEQLEVLEKQARLEDARSGKGGEIGGTIGEGITGEGTGDEIAAIADRFKTEEELLREKLEKELTLVGDNNQLKEQLHQEFLDNIFNMEEEAGQRDLDRIAEKAEAEAKLKEKSDKETIKKQDNLAKNEAKIETQKAAFASRTAQTLLSSTLTTQEKLFSVVKDGAAGAIEAHGLTAGAKALAELGPIAGPPAAASVVGWSQVAAGIVRSLSFGGGGGSSGGGAGAIGVDTAQAQQSFQPEEFTQETSVTAIGGGSSSTTTEDFTFQNEGGSSADEILTEFINDSVKSGRLTVGRAR